MRLEELAKLEGDGINVTWKSFLLRPQPEERSIEQFTEYTNNWQRPADMEPNAPFSWPWSGQNVPPSYSVPAAVAGKVAATFGQESWHLFHRRLLETYFVENRTISELDVFSDVAAEVGIDEAEFRSTYLDQSSMLAQGVLEEHNEAIRRGVNGVPAVVVEDTYLISGAVDVAHYQAALERYREIRAAEQA